MRARFARWNREAARQALQGLALWALVLLLLPPAEAAVWQCEGRVCGVTPWACCCDLPSDKTDASCANAAPGLNSHRRSASHVQEVGNCPRSCHCTQVASHSQSARASVPATAVPSLEVVAILPVVWQSREPVAAQPARPFESRGPPLLAPVPSSTSPRGPPLCRRVLRSS
jgi:hypothetical protein